MDPYPLVWLGQEETFKTTLENTGSILMYLGTGKTLPHVREDIESQELSDYAKELFLERAVLLDGNGKFVFISLDTNNFDTLEPL